MPSAHQSKRAKSHRCTLNLNVGWLAATLIAFQFGRYWEGSRCSSCGNRRASLSGLRSNQLDHQALAPPEEATGYSGGCRRNDDGWHSIDVFYGNTSHLDATPPTVAFRPRLTPKAIQDWYGQAQQDKIVFELLGGKTNGYFVDLAANDARTLSNTFALERHHNWTGICMEPNPQYWHHLAYRKCHVVAAVVGRHRMEEVQFRFQSGAQGVIGGIVNDEFDQTTEKDAKEAGPPTPKFTVPLLEVLQRYKAPHDIDYLSLDVEGAEEYIMSIFPIDEYRIKIMTVERPSEGLQIFLKQHGFQMLRELTKWGETLWAHESFLRDKETAAT